jgi:hypothetical protein
MSTLFQDSAGSMPVTAVEQPVGRMLDKSGNGNHATQATGSLKPTLSARKNLLTHTNTISNAAYNKVRSTWADATVVAPDGTTTAGTLTATSNGYAYFNFSSSLSGTRTLSCYAKAGTSSDFSLALDGSSGNDIAKFNLTTGIVTQVGSNNVSASMSDEGNGWWRCSVTRASAGTACFFGDETMLTGETQHVWHPQLEYGSTATTYQRVTTATDYDTAGFPMYLKFDGVDDGLVTSSVSFTTTDKVSVFAGLAKLSDAGAATVVELSATTASNNGSFQLTAPDGAAATFGFASKGTVLASASIGSLASPISKVITGLGDVSGDSVRIDVNGADGTPVATDQGTGNYGNYPLYIGRRGGASQPLNGNAYQLVILGRTATGTEISNTESFIATKSGITI